MSFSDAISQVSQIQAMEQQLFSDPTSLVGGTATSGTTATDDTAGTSSTDSSSSAFSAALADAQSSDATSALTSSDDTDGTDSASSGTADSVDLLSGGDSQLLSELSSMGATGTDSADGDADAGTGGTSASSVASALESALESSSGATSTDGTSESGLVSALESALESSGSSSPTVQTDSGVSGGTATSSSDPRIQAMTEEANALVGQPYVYGGGHDGWGPQSGYDCSGFVSAVLHAGGYLSTPQDTTTLPSAVGMESGPGQYVTIYDRDATGKQGHVIMDIDGQFYESGGSHGSWGGGGGVEEISTPSAAYLSTFNTVLHPEGL